MPSGSVVNNAPFELSGTVLYSQHCAGCHGAIDSTPKSNKSAESIAAAIVNVPSMKSLDFLTPAQVQAIAEALAPAPMVQAQCTPQNRGSQKEGVRRLTGFEIINSIDAFRFSGLGLDDGKVPNLQQMFTNFPDSDLVEYVEKYDPYYKGSQELAIARIVDYLASAVVSFNTAPAVDACMSEATISDSCWNVFFNRLGRKVYRRPLMPDELTRLTTLVKSRGTRNDAIYAAVTLLIRSPAFLFHYEMGSSEEASRVRLTDHEVANRISFAILGAPPDDELASAADQGQLKTLTQVRTHVDRLLEKEWRNPRDTDSSKTLTQRVKLNRFFHEWLKLSQVQTPNSDFMYWIRDLGHANGSDKGLQREIEDYMHYMFWRKKASFQEMMTAQVAFPRLTYQLTDALDPNKTVKPFSLLSFVFGTQYSDRFNRLWSPSDRNVEATPFPAPNNPGLIARPGLLSTSLEATQPIRRGVFVLRRILCEDLPDPDFSIVNQREAEAGNLDPRLMPNHQITSALTSGAACLACHSKINPLGFALESYDVFGQLRNSQNVLTLSNIFSEAVNSPARGVAASHPLLSPVAGVYMGPGKTVTVSNPKELADHLSQSEAARQCLPKFVIRHFERRKEVPLDNCAVNEVAQGLANGEPVVNVFTRLLANEDIFWRRK